MGKVCIDCKKKKAISEFYEHSEMADGHLRKCKSCVRKRVSRHRKENISRVKAYDLERYRYSEQRFFLSKYYGMKQRNAGLKSIHKCSSFGKGVCSKEEFLEWCKKNVKTFRKLYKQWEAGNYQRKLAPSIDRISNNIGYFPENIQWMTQQDNSKKS